MGDLGREKMVEALLAAFPSIKDDLLDDTWSNLLHPQMGSFARYTQEAIDRGDRNVVKTCFDLANQFFREGTPELENAVGVSFLEQLNFDDGKRRRAWARDLLPPQLRKVLQEIEA